MSDYPRVPVQPLELSPDRPAPRRRRRPARHARGRPARRLRRQRRRRGRAPATPVAPRARPTRSASPRTQPLEVVIFNGGSATSTPPTCTSRSYKKAYPKSKVKHSPAEEISTVVQPRFAGGNPPDMINNSGSKLMDFGALVAGRPAAGPDRRCSTRRRSTTRARRSGTPWSPAPSSTGTFNGKPYVLNYVVHRLRPLVLAASCSRTTAGPPPKTWAEFTALLRQDQGRRASPRSPTPVRTPPYYMYTCILTSAAKIGGAEVLKNIDNLEDGAWTARRGQAGRRGVGRDRRQVHQQGAPGPQAHRGPAPAEPGQGGLLPVAAPGWRTSRSQGHPGRLRVPDDADPERHRLATSCPSTALCAAAGESYFVAGQGQEPAGRHGVPAPHAVQGRRRRASPS